MLKSPTLQILTLLTAIGASGCASESAVQPSNQTIPPSNSKFVETDNSRPPSRNPPAPKPTSQAISVEKLESDLIGKRVVYAKDNDQAWIFQDFEPRIINIDSETGSGSKKTIVAAIKTCDVVPEAVGKRGWQGSVKFFYVYVDGKWSLKEIESIDFKRDPEVDPACDEYIAAATNNSTEGPREDQKMIEWDTWRKQQEAQQQQQQRSEEEWRRNQERMQEMYRQNQRSIEEQRQRLQAERAEQQRRQDQQRQEYQRQQEAIQRQQWQQQQQRRP